MNLNITPRPVRSGFDELGPSRYAVQVGDIEVLVISDGVLLLPTKMLGHKADPAVRATWMKDMFFPPDAFDWALTRSSCAAVAKPSSLTRGLGPIPTYICREPDS